MKIVHVSKEVRYTLTDEKDNEHHFVVGELSKDENGESVIHIAGSHEHEEIEIPLVEIPFLIKVLNMFLEDARYGRTNN